MNPYREADHSELAAFSKHVTIAETLLGVIDDLHDRLRLHPHPDLHRGVGEAWSNLWEQLQQARGIALRLGRDVSAFDAEYVKLENPYIAAARNAPIRQAMKETAIESANALRAAIPEVVVPSGLKPKLSQPLDGVPRQLMAPTSFRIPPRAWACVGTLLALLLYAVAH